MLHHSEVSPLKRKAYHALIPATMPAIFFLVAATPVEALGCATRGLLVLLVALVSGLAAVGAAFLSGRGRSCGDAYAPWWAVTTLILTIPVVALVILA